MATQGRVESRFTAPSGVTASVSTGAHTTAVTVTTPAAGYFHTAAGGVSSWATTFQTQLNENVQGYPLSAAALQTAVGYGTWTAGWLCNETSGNLAAAFGAPTLTAVNTPTYGTAGPRAGVDLAVGFDGSTDGFSGGDVHDVNATSDLCFAIVAKFSSLTGTLDVFGKWHTANPRYLLYRNAAELVFNVNDGTDNADATVTGFSTETWVAIMGVLDRGANQVRLAFCPLGGSATVGSTTSTAAIGTLENTQNFGIGNLLFGADTGVKIAALYVGTGTGAASGMSANLSTAVTNFANAVNSSFTVSLETTNLTGLYTVSNNFWPFDIAWTNTTQRDVAGYDRDITYPQTAAQLTSALGGYGGWSAGWLCNEASGDLSPVFGSITLADSGTPSYSNLGARGGSDKAIKLVGAADAFSGGDVLDTGASNDLFIVWVGRWEAAASRDFFHKFAGAAGWVIYSPDTTSVRFLLHDGVDQVTTDAAALPVGEHYVGIAALDRAAGTFRIGVQGLVSGTQTLSANTSAAAIGDMTNAVALTMGQCASAAGNGAGHIVSAWYIGQTATGVPAALGTILSTFCTYMKSQTGTKQAKSLWFPDCTFNIDDDPRTAPRQSDLRTSQSPTGVVLGLCGNEFYEQSNARWTHVPENRYREDSATYANASLETFWRDCMTAQSGISWFTPASPVQIYYDHAGVQTAVGSDESISGWYITGAGGIRDVAKKAHEAWTGQWAVTFPKLISSG